MSDAPEVKKLVKPRGTKLERLQRREERQRLELEATKVARVESVREQVHSIIGNIDKLAAQCVAEDLRLIGEACAKAKAPLREVMNQ